MSEESTSDRHALQLRTHTSLWTVEKRLYKIYDYTLPAPVSIKQVGYFVGFSIPWFILLGAIGLPFASPWHLVWIAPPVIVTYAASKPVAEGKRLGELVWSQIVYLTQPKTMARLASHKEPDVIHVSARTWQPTGATAD